MSMNFPVASLSQQDLEQIQQLESKLNNQNANSNTILIAYTKQGE